METEFLAQIQQFFININQDPYWAIPFLVWTTVLKGISLWKAAGNKSKKWFIVLLVANTLGILELLYFFVFSKKEEKKNN